MPPDGSNQNDVNGQQNEDEIRRKLLKPKVTPEDVLSVLNDFYVGSGSDGTNDERRAEVLRELDSYDDVNYLVKIDGVKYLLKVQNGVESEKYIAARNARASRKRPRSEEKSNVCDVSAQTTSLIDLQTSIFECLSASKHNVCTSRVIPMANHCHGQSEGDSNESSAICIRNLPVVSAQHSPQPLAVRLHSWVEGSPLSSAKWFPIEALADAGTYLGRMCHALDDLSTSNADAVEAAKRYHAWDGRHLLDLEAYVDFIDDIDKRKQVSSIINSFRKSIVEMKEGQKFRMSINHGDFNDANIIVNDKDGTGLTVCGVIDFGDTVYSWRVLDVTVAMAYALISSYGKCNRSISAACALLRGFHYTYPLTLDERKHLRLLVACRLAQSVTFGNYTYKQNPENEYILFHAKPAWEALDFIWGTDGRGAGGNTAEAVENMFSIACENIVLSPDSSIPSCIDITFPDPSIVDPLASARTLVKESSSKNVKSSKTITFVTGNKKKAEEVRRILSSGQELPFSVINHKVDLPELQGDPIEIAQEKCSIAAKKIKGAVITEDTSLCFSALNGLPGPYIKWFLDKNGLDGLNNMISFSEDKSAYAQTVVAFCPGPGEDIVTFDGRTQGKIVRPRGKLDFGWDPIFEPDEGNGLTYAEMSGEQKDSISHRKRAFLKFRNYLEQENEFA